MKIVYISSANIPGKKAHAYQIVQMCEAFASLGHEVTLYTFKGDKNVDDLYRVYGVDTKFAVEQVWVPVLGFLPNYFKHKIKLLWFIWSLKGRVKEYDVVVTRDWWVPRVFKNTILNVHHSVDGLSPRRKKTVASAKAIIASSPKVKEKLVEVGAPEEKVSVVSNGVKLSEYTKCSGGELKELGLSRTSDKAVLYVGAFFDWKGVHVLAEAAKYLEGVDVIMAGANEKQVAEFTEKYPYKNLFVLPFVEHRKTPCMFVDADVLVLPNIENEDPASLDTAPIKLFGCMGSGTPTIVSDIPAMRAFVNEQHVLFAPQKDPKGLAEVIRKHFENPVEGEERARVSKERAETFTWEERAKEILTKA